MRVAVWLAAVVIAFVAAPAASAGGFAGSHALHHEAPSRTTTTHGAPLPCNDTKYTFLGPNARWASTLRWRFRASSVPSGLNSRDVLAIIKRSFRNVVNGRNDCGRPDRISATQSYLGTTSRKPGITAAGACSSPDGHSVIGFAALDGYYAGYTCIWWNGSAQIYEMDMRLDPQQPWALSLATCSNELMMESLVTHEVGHAFGLGHVGEARHGRLTMSVYIDGNCQNQEATLGAGDLNGLERLY